MTNKGEFGFMWMSDVNLEWVRALFSDGTKELVFHNAKFDLKMFLVHGIDIFSAKAKCHCTLILSKLYNGLMQSYELRWLAKVFCNRRSEAKDAVDEWLKANKRQFQKEHGRAPNFSDVPFEILRDRNLWDVKSTLLLFYFMHPRVTQVRPKLYETERELMFAVVDMEHTGVEVDITHAEQLRDANIEYIDELQRDLDAIVCPLVIARVCCVTKGCRKKNIKVLFADSQMPTQCPKCGGTELDIKTEQCDTFNTNSSAIQVVLAWEKLGIPLLYKTKPKKGKKGGKKTGGGRWSFDEYAMLRYSPKEVVPIIRDSGEEGWPYKRWRDTLYNTAALHNIPHAHLVPAMILKINEMKKLNSTYYEHLISQCVDVRTEPSGRKVGVLHANFNQSEAMTGRFSSSNPNLQNMPRILGPRECFIPRRGRWNFHFDYEQVEMKFFVHFSQDEDMARAIEGDIHLYVASQIYHLPQDRVSKEQRKRAKGVNFGILYGSGPKTMSETLTKKGLVTTIAEATVLVAQYHRRFPSIRRITNEIKNDLIRKGFISNPFGRAYHIDVKFGYRGLNYLCQGTSADQMKLGLLKLWKWLRANGMRSKIICTVHDEIIVEIPPSERHVVPRMAIQLMEDRTSFFIPITVDCEIVKDRWSKKYKPSELSVSLN